jgi:hypothetical protein
VEEPTWRLVVRLPNQRLESCNLADSVDVHCVWMGISYPSIVSPLCEPAGSSEDAVPTLQTYDIDQIARL